MKSGERVAFSFGENWAKYLARIDDAKVAQATESLEEAFGAYDLANRDFIDVGSGSGLFSLAAQRLGAGSILSVDVDPDSIACTTALRGRAGNPPEWRILHGSVLDPSFLASVGVADRIYSWGVLHHTGSMWAALDAVLDLIAPGGVACIALYNRPRRPRLQLTLKRTYNRLPSVLRPLMAALYACASVMRMLVAGTNPVRYVRSYSQTSRGMSFRRDIDDWLGGLPYEYAEPAEVAGRVTGRGMQLVRTVVRSPGANNEYLILRSD